MQRVVVLVVAASMSTTDQVMQNLVLTTEALTARLEQIEGKVGPGQRLSSSVTILSGVS